MSLANNNTCIYAVYADSDARESTGLQSDVPGIKYPAQDEEFFLSRVDETKVLFEHKFNPVKPVKEVDSSYLRCQSDWVDAEATAEDKLWCELYMKMTSLEGDNGKYSKLMRS